MKKFLILVCDKCFYEHSQRGGDLKNADFDHRWFQKGNCTICGEPQHYGVFYAEKKTIKGN